MQSRGQFVLAESIIFSPLDSEAAALTTIVAADPVWR